MALSAISMTDYSSFFRHAIMRSLKHVLASVQETKTHVLAEEREQALYTLTYTLKMRNAWPHSLELLLIIAPNMEQEGYRDGWMVYLQSAIEQSLRLKDPQGEAKLRFHLGVLHKYLAEFQKAAREFDSSAAYFERVGEPHLQARALSHLGDVVRFQRDFHKATQLVHTALELVPQENAQQAHSYLVLGTIALDLRQWEDAGEWFEQSLALSEEMNDQRLIAWSLNNLGIILKELKKYQEAIACYKRASQLYERIQDPFHQALARINLGNVYFALERWQEALELYLLVKRTFRETPAGLHLARVNNNIGMAYQKLQQWDNAKRAFLSSIEQWEQIGRTNSLVNTLDNLGLLYLEQERIDEAINTFQDALKWLAQMKNDPTYHYYSDMVTRHLEEAIKLK
ncbi:MAG: tetratricopeptide repeat protein [Ardenticatenaceae bacterium]